MSRYKLKNGGRRKAMLGADGAVMAAATLAAAGINALATNNAASKQADAMVKNAQTQKDAMLAQNENSNKLQEKSIEFTRSQNEINRKQQEDIQATLQMMAGQQNMNDIMEANKMQVRNGGRPKRRKLKTAPSYGGGSQPFNVTDGGAMIPVQVYPEGILYEAYGNDHEHYHKTKGGKNKTGVGIKFKDGSELEVEGNQNTNQGEYLFSDFNGNDAVAISKHSIKGFNPAQAVNQGMHPSEAFAYQEQIKDMYNIPDYGNKAKCGGRKKAKKLYGGYNLLMDNSNLTQNPANNTGNVAVGAAYATSPLERRQLKCGGRKKAGWGDWAGSVYSGAGNLAAGIIGGVSNYYAGKKLAAASQQASNYLIEGYNQLKGISMDSIKESDFAAPEALAVTRLANTNINPQLERVRRNSNAETRAINRNTLSSAARQQRLAGTNDRMRQSMSELYAYKQNADEQIKQSNAQRITEVAQENANRKMQARQNYTNQKLALLQYNNNIENQKIMGIAGAKSDAELSSAQAMANSYQQIGNIAGQTLTSIAGTFGDTANAINKRNEEQNFTVGMSTDSAAQANIMLANNKTYGFTPEGLENVYNNLVKAKSPQAEEFAKRFGHLWGYKSTKQNTYDYAQQYIKNGLPLFINPVI